MSKRAVAIKGTKAKNVIRLGPEAIGGAKRPKAVMS
jgi:hypothetical protein